MDEGWVVGHPALGDEPHNEIVIFFGHCDRFVLINNEANFVTNPNDPYLSMK